MNKKLMTFLSVLVILVFIGYIIFDIISPAGSVSTTENTVYEKPIPDAWEVSGELKTEEGALKTVSISSGGNVYLGGDSFVSCYDKEMKLTWTIKTPVPVTSVYVSNDTLFASSMELIYLISKDGKILNEWGPYESNCIITSLTANNTYVAFADAGNRIVYILDKEGEVKSMIGQNDDQFVVPSPYFDLSIDDNNRLFIANTGHRRIETRNLQGELIGFFGEAGTAPEAFCGCCNPAHFAVIPTGFVTAEKGLNRIKILGKNGEFIEYVSSDNKFTASIPLDVASFDGETVYAANPADSKLYIFTRK
jgi:hypothetical protein